MTISYLYILIHPLQETKLTPYLDLDGDISNFQVCLIQTAEKVKHDNPPKLH